MTETRSELEAERQDLVNKLGAVEADIADIKSKMAARLSGIEGDAQRFRTRIGQIDSEIRRREERDAVVPTISDHALLRYIERVHGIDVDGMKAELLTDTMVLAIKNGANAVKSSEGTFMIKGSTVVTFIDHPPHQKKKARGRRPEREEEWEEDVA